MADFEEFIFCSKRFEFRQIPAGLAHHPDGHVVDVLATGGPEDEVVFESRKIILEIMKRAIVLVLEVSVFGRLLALYKKRLV